MPSKLPIWDRRMMLLMQHAIDTGKCDTKQEFLASIGMMTPQNLADVRKGRRSFTVEQQVAACKKYGISMNWLAGLDDNMMRKPSKNPIDRLKEVTREIEAIGK